MKIFYLFTLIIILFSCQTVRIEKRLHSKGSEVNIRIFSVNGVELLSKRLILGETIVHELPEGTYIVQINIEGTWTSKLLLVD